MNTQLCHCTLQHNCQTRHCRGMDLTARDLCRVPTLVSHCLRVITSGIGLCHMARHEKPQLVHLDTQGGKADKDGVRFTTGVQRLTKELHSIYPLVRLSTIRRLLSFQNTVELSSQQRVTRIAQTQKTIPIFHALQKDSVQVDSDNDTIIKGQPTSVRGLGLRT